MLAPCRHTVAHATDDKDGTTYFGARPFTPQQPESPADSLIEKSDGGVVKEVAELFPERTEGKSKEMIVQQAKGTGAADLTDNDLAAARSTQSIIETAYKATTTPLDTPLDLPDSLTIWSAIKSVPVTTRTNDSLSTILS